MIIPELHEQWESIVTIVVSVNEHRDGGSYNHLNEEDARDFKKSFKDKGGKVQLRRRFVSEWENVE